MSDTPKQLDALPESVIDAAVAAWFNTEGSYTVRMRAALTTQAQKYEALLAYWKDKAGRG